jgi:HEAT repeat protein
LTTDKSVILRTNAVRALGDLGTGQAIPVLEAVLADPRNPAADAARKSIERIKQRLATPHPPLKTE